MAVNRVQSNFQEGMLWKKRLHRFMEIRDVNKDGLMQRADFKLVIQRYRDMGASEEHITKICCFFEKTYDLMGIVDDSVTLTYDEFARRFAKQIGLIFRKNMGDQLFLSMFKVVDADSDGKITFEEWFDYYRALGIDTDHARASFDAMDTNGDGIVSVKEFTVYHKEFFFTTEDTLNSSILFGPLK